MDVIQRCVIPCSVTICHIGEWDFRAPGFTAIAHPELVSLAENHGVFLLENMRKSWEAYVEGMIFIMDMYVCTQERHVI